MDVKSARPLCPAAHVTNARTDCANREGELIGKNVLSSDCSLARLHEAGIASNGASDDPRELVSDPAHLDADSESLNQPVI